MVPASIQGVELDEGVQGTTKVRRKSRTRPEAQNNDIAHAGLTAMQTVMPKAAEIGRFDMILKSSRRHDPTIRPTPQIARPGLSRWSHSASPLSGALESGQQYLIHGPEQTKAQHGHADYGIGPKLRRLARKYPANRPTCSDAT